MDEQVTITEADFADAEHQRAAVELLNAYAMGPIVGWAAVVGPGAA